MSNLRITDIKTYIVPAVPHSKGQWNKSKTFLFVKLETNKGIDGWGEAYALGQRERSTEMLFTEMKRYLIDYDPSRIKYFQYWVYNLFGERRPGIDLFCAASGIEIAMWDIMGKYYNTPVYNLLGGQVHNKLRMYANINSDFESLSSEIEKAREMVKLGYTAIKISPFDYCEEEDGIIERVAKLREAIGDKVDLLVDVWRNADAKLVLNVAQRIEPYRICWFEEPIAPDNLDVAAEIRSKTSLSIVAGECICGKRGANEVFKKNAADILNVDVTVVGGILELKEIAAMAEANYIKIAPHNCNSHAVGTFASVNAACTMPNFYLLEIFPSYREMGEKICKNPLPVEEGYIHIPDAPGLGVEMNEDYLASITYREGPKDTRKITGQIGNQKQY